MVMEPTSVRGALAHLKYIDRRGDLIIQTDRGETVQGADAEAELVADWDLELLAAMSQAPYKGNAGRTGHKLVHNVVLSMPPGTPSTKLLAASREFARETFGMQHRYAMVLHTDQDHPHVHLAVKAVSEEGRRLYPQGDLAGSAAPVRVPFASSGNPRECHRTRGSWTGTRPDSRWDIPRHLARRFA